MRKCLVLCVAVVLSVHAAADGGQLEGIWVTTDASVDTSSPEAIIAGLVRPGMSDEEKALAIFNWYRRVIYPHNYMGPDRRDVLRQINSYGCTLCGSHAANLGWLMRVAGFKTRCVFIRNGGHTFIEVWYENRWHALDPETDFAVWSRAREGEKPYLISMEDLKADPTLLDNAEAEGRAKPWFFKAMKFPFATRKVMADYCDTHKLDKMAMQWSSCVLKGETLKDYFIEGVKTLKYSKENDAYGGQVSDPNLMKLTLRAGETLTRTWDNEGKGSFIAGQGFAGYPAHFMAAGGADESDVEVFPFVEPYRKDNYGIPELAVDRCYRYHGNGRLVWKPASAHQLATAAGVKLDNAVADRDAGPIRIADPARPASITIPIRSSYALVRGEVRVAWADPSKPGKVVAVVGRNETELAPTTRPQSEPPAETLYEVGRAINGQFNYAIRIELPPGGGLRAAAFEHLFTNNWLVLPALRPGQTKVRVRLANPDALKNVKLTIRYEWAEGDGWKIEKHDEREVTGSPFEYELTAAGPKWPRMKRLVLIASPR